jgi:hypothetical protein
LPVTAKLSRKFYETLGDDVANELVEWFNQVDATYRADLRDLNELNFARFDAKMEQRFAESDAKWERRFAQQDAKWEQRFAQQDAKWEQLRAEFHRELGAAKADLIKWAFVFWVPTALGVIGLYFRG